jgi:hypothetical protein
MSTLASQIVVLATAVHSVACISQSSRFRIALKTVFCEYFLFSCEWFLYEANARVLVSVAMASTTIQHATDLSSETLAEGVHHRTALIRRQKCPDVQCVVYVEGCALCSTTSNPWVLRQTQTWLHYQKTLHALIPPSTRIVCPLMYRARSDERKVTAAATSLGAPPTPAGTAATNSFEPPCSSKPAV